MHTETLEGHSRHWEFAQATQVFEDTLYLYAQEVQLEGADGHKRQFVFVHITHESETKL